MEANLVIRRAVVDDIPALILLLADDALGATRESPANLTPYQQAFAAIDADPNQLLIAAERDQVIIGTMQLTFLRGLSHQGATRCQIEAVRIAAPLRGQGLGSELIRWAIDCARERGCALVQLTSHNNRIDAHRFYERLGFSRSHAGFKLALH